MRKIISYCLAGVYLLTGVFLLIKRWYVLSPLQNIAVGILFVIYAIFRGYRTYHSSFDIASEDSGSSAEN
ncbi:MAG: hypothetical protein HXX13_13185 [Bacteroidetes bacterium]|nr:hypothetical protein [Bacteroidota bacterium]